MNGSSSTTVQPAQGTPKDVTAVAGRGAAYITIAKIWFMVSGYGIYFALPRLLTPEQFGLYQVVISVVSIVNAVVITGTYQAVSKYVSQEPEKADSVKNAALKVQVLVGGGLSLGFCLLAPLLAWYLRDSRLVNYFRLAAAITFFYSFYSVFTGYFNGQKLFLKQASLDMTYSTLKAVFIVTLAWLGYGAAGGVGGFALAAAGITFISAFAARGAGKTGEIGSFELFRFQAYLLLSILVINGLQKADIILVKALSAGGVEVASQNAGYYGAAVNVANITYQIIISVTFVIFPLISEASFREERQRTAGYISTTLRYTLMIMVGTATVFSANSARILGIIYPPGYQSGATALSIIAYGALFYGLLYVMVTIISASGRPLVSLGISGAALLANVALNYGLIPWKGLSGAATGATAAMLLGVVIAGSFLRVKYGTLLPAASILRILLSAAVVYGLSLILPHGSKIIGLAELSAVSILFVVCLLVTGELGRAEVLALRKIVKG